MRKLFLLVFVMINVSSLFAQENLSSHRVEVSIGPLFRLSNSGYDRQLEIGETKFLLPSLGVNCMLSKKVSNESEVFFALNTVFFDNEDISEEKNYLAETSIPWQEKERQLMISGITADISLNYSRNFFGEKLMPFLGAGASVSYLTKTSEAFQAVQYYSVVINPDPFNPGRYRELSSPSERDRERSDVLNESFISFFGTIGLKYRLSDKVIAVGSVNRHFSDNSKLYVKKLDVGLALVVKL